MNGTNHSKRHLSLIPNNQRIVPFTDLQKYSIFLSTMQIQMSRTLVRTILALRLSSGLEFKPGDGGSLSEPVYHQSRMALQGQVCLSCRGKW